MSGRGCYCGDCRRRHCDPLDGCSTPCVQHLPPVPDLPIVEQNAPAVNAGASHMNEQPRG